jgi:hypothetical protein
MPRDRLQDAHDWRRQGAHGRGDTSHGSLPHRQTIGLRLRYRW